MGTKEELIKLFENNKGKYFSGEEIARELSLSRAAVWKAVNALKSDGYEIDAVRNKGYSLSISTDILSSEGIKKYLSDELLENAPTIEVLTVTDSTNNYARQKAQAGEGDLYTVVAAEQIGGKGRRGRSFYSPAGSGVYMSLVLRPSQCSGEAATRYTTMAAVAVCQAIETVSHRRAEIKWVNDVFMQNKKVCGILTEASFGLEDGYLDYAILGIGINVLPPKDGFPTEIRDVAGTVFESCENDAKNRIAAEIINRFAALYKESNHDNYIEEYKKRSFVLGKEVTVITPVSSRSAKAIDIDGECRLIVEYPDGTTEALSSGEISVKLK